MKITLPQVIDGYTRSGAVFLAVAIMGMVTIFTFDVDKAIAGKFLIGAALICVVYLFLGMALLAGAIDQIGRRPE